MRSCGFCGGKIPMRRGMGKRVAAKRRYCSLRCWGAAKSAAYQLARPRCAHCNGPIKVSGKKYCSWKCYLTGFKRPVGKAHGAWTGGRGIDGSGYMTVHMRPDHPWANQMRQGNGRVLEHRIVMAESLGRALEPYETVHHKNGNRSDNRIENLELWHGRHGRGQRAVDVGYVRVCDMIAADPSFAAAWNKFNRVICLEPASGR